MIAKVSVYGFTLPREVRQKLFLFGPSSHQHHPSNGNQALVVHVFVLATNLWVQTCSRHFRRMFCTKSKSKTIRMEPKRSDRKRSEAIPGCVAGSRPPARPGNGCQTCPGRDERLGTEPSRCLATRKGKGLRRVRRLFSSFFFLRRVPFVGREKDVQKDTEDMLVVSSIPILTQGKATGLSLRVWAKKNSRVFGLDPLKGRR